MTSKYGSTMLKYFTENDWSALSVWFGLIVTIITTHISIALAKNKPINWLLVFTGFFVCVAIFIYYGKLAQSRIVTPVVAPAMTEGLSETPTTPTAPVFTLLGNWAGDIIEGSDKYFVRASFEFPSSEYKELGCETQLCSIIKISPENDKGLAITTLGNVEVSENHISIKDIRSLELADKENGFWCFANYGLSVSETGNNLEGGYENTYEVSTQQPCTGTGVINLSRIQP
jgi:hypothetical protein